MNPTVLSDPKEKSLVNSATRTARNVVGIAFACTALLVSLLAVDRIYLHRANAAAVLDVRSAQALVDEILLEDERLTMSANMAAATGEGQWVRRYEERLPKIDAAIAKATAMAEPAAAAAFDKATREANDKLVDIERQAFNYITVGSLDKARQLLSSPNYSAQKATLANGTDVFIQALQASVQARHDAIELRSIAWMVFLLATSVGAFFWLWSRLNHHLARAQEALAAQQAEVSRLALQDPLTGLANRRYLRMQLDTALGLTRRNTSTLAVLMIDLDGFKPVNDSLGHAAGDLVLVEIGKRLAQQVRDGEVAARLGGDEFVVVLVDTRSHHETKLAARRLIAAVSSPIALPQGTVRVGASAGIAFFPDDSLEADDLLAKADAALYRAKSLGRGEVQFYKTELNSRSGPLGAASSGASTTNPSSQAMNAINSPATKTLFIK